LSETKNRFRVRNGEIEIEYESALKEVNKRYDDALKWLARAKRLLKRAVSREKVSTEKKCSIVENRLTSAHTASARAASRYSSLF
jgi:hypothetical protein